MITITEEIRTKMVSLSEQDINQAIFSLVESDYWPALLVLFSKKKEMYRGLYDSVSPLDSVTIAKTQASVSVLDDIVSDIINRVEKLKDNNNGNNIPKY